MDVTTKTGLIVLIAGIVISVIESLIGFLTNGAYTPTVSGLILLIGIILMFFGRKEFGEKHSKFVIIAGIIFLINIMIIVIVYANYFLSIPSIVGSIDTSTPNVDLTVLKGALNNIFLIIPIGAFLNSLFFFFMFYHLEDKKGKIILSMGIIVSILIAVYLTFAGMQITAHWIDKFEIVVNDLIENPPFISFGTPDEIEDALLGFQSDMSKITVYGILSNIIFLIATIIPYRRIKKGELQPKLPLNLKRCIYCNCINPSDSVVCAYCGNSFNGFKQPETNFNQNYGKY